MRALSAALINARFFDGIRTAVTFFALAYSVIVQFGS